MLRWLAAVEFQEVVRRRRMVRRYDVSRPVPGELVDKGFTDRSDAWWSAHYWGIDAGFASLLMLLAAVDAGLGACFFGIPAQRIDAYRAAFGVPEHFVSIGAISVGYSDEPPRDPSSRRKPAAETVHPGPVEPAGQ